MPPIPPRSLLSGVSLSFVVSLLVYLAVCALALWIGGRERSLGKNDNGRGHTKHQHSCPGIIVSPLALWLGSLPCVALHLAMWDVVIWPAV